MPAQLTKILISWPSSIIFFVSADTSVSEAMSAVYMVAFLPNASIFNFVAVFDESLCQELANKHTMTFG